MPRELVGYSLGTKEYGVGILRLQEARTFETCTRRANMPGPIESVATVRYGDAVAC